MSSFDKQPALPRDATPTTDVAVVRSAEASGQQRLPLSQETAGRGPVPGVPRAVTRSLWIALCLPGLPLESLRGNASGPFAVFEERQGIRRVLMACRAARTAGVEPGQSVNAALSICATLELAERDPAGEAALVERLAAWADRFTSFVVIEDDNLLLLEVAGSLRLFGGIERICDELREHLASRGLTAMLAVAATPLASVWLARAGGDPRSRDRLPASVEELASRLGDVSLDCTGWSDTVIAKLSGMGVTCIRDCLRLSRQGFARRFGVQVLNDLDRALGRLPDPREHYRQPERYSGDVEFESEEEDSQRILAGCRKLLVDLERFLRTRQVQVQRIRVSFFHRRDKATHLAFGCARAGQNAERWFELLEYRFERVVLSSPVVAVRLQSGRSEAGVPAVGRLLTTSRSDGSAGELSIEALVERLSARIGEGAVHGIETVAEHRPQHAWRKTPVTATPRPAAVPGRYWNAREEAGAGRRPGKRLLLRRPLWMLEEPAALEAEGGRPLYRGLPLHLEGPERLESGWWDDDGIARDYFIAQSDDGIRLWVFRDYGRGRQRSSGWYLHGMFG